MNVKEKQLDSILKSGKLLEIKLFQVNDNFFEFSGGSQWIIDGGIELTFPVGKITVGWSTKEEMFCFELKAFSDLYNSFDYLELHNESINNLKNILIGNKLIETSYKWITYEYVIDYLMNTKKETSIAELSIVFNSGDRLQIAAINYDIESAEKSKNYRYDVSRELFVSLNTYEEISDVT